MPTQVELWLGRGTGALERTPLPVPIFTFFFFVLVVQLNFPLESTYAFLFVVAGLTLLWFDRVMELQNRRLRREHPEYKLKRYESVLDIQSYTAVDAFVPFTVGMASVGSIFLIFVFWSGQITQTGASVADIFRNIVTGVVVAIAEEFAFRYVYMKVYGGILPQVMFGLSHPAVRDLLISGQYASAVVPFFYFTIIGLALQQLVIFGEATNVPKKYRQFFGLSLTTGAHAMINALLAIFPTLMILGVAVHVW